MTKFNLLLTIIMVLLVSCESEDTSKVITQGDYPLKEYYLERNPKINVWGAGIDFVHEECQLDDTDLDYKYLVLEDSFAYDIMFYTVKAYYYDSAGDLQNEGCPAFLLSEDVTACKLGEGIGFFDSLTVISEEMILQLKSDPLISYDNYKDEATGFYEQEALFSALDECVIGQRFRSNVLVIPEGKTEQEVQNVYLIKTREGAFVKFMVKEFKPAKPQEKQSLVQWQIINE